jgi:hypothetical protein
MENVSQLIGLLQSLLKEHKSNSETPLQAYIDYVRAECEVLERLLGVPLNSVQ